ncbi:type VII secretion system-associated protein [Streptomyces griseoloalbus]|uniref:type VII secretion system-associated protein n=1 Tax=Streptomyces griseoloalbus TaxID=67303 RepID=UPI00160E7575|nr:type VII secretion system-associated protein [Streptomyces albaduncus]
MRPGERQEGRHGDVFAAPDDPGPAAAPRPSAHEPPAPEPSVADATEAVDTPEIPEAVRDAARRAPGHWIGVVDPEWTERRTPPEWAVLGEWQSDENGGVGDYRANPAYRPSARVLGWPEPTDPVDAAAQRAATGYGSVDEALAALAEAEVTVVRGPDGGPLTAAGRDGAPVVLLFTSPAHEFMSAALRHDTLPARELARSLSGSGTLLMVNAGAAAPLLVPADGLPGLAGHEAAPAADAAAEKGSGAPSGTADRTGPPAAAPAADRTDSSPEPRPHIAGRTP